MARGKDMSKRMHVVQAAPAATAGEPRRSWRRFCPLAAGPSWYLHQVVAEMEVNMLLCGFFT